MTKTAATAISFDDLPDAEDVQYTRGSYIDVESDTPDKIKAAVNESFAGYKPKGHDAEKPNLVVAKWKKQECGSTERAEAFLKLARRYATNKDMTLRGAVDVVDGKPGTSVTFLAKPKESKMILATDAATETPAKK